ncbi:glycosyltransferase family 4 protein [Sphingomonas glacialis]|uniref:Glycosyltransferase n=1 Tax=Sphingomonas glacialis TaxID=658225 RepID=A0A502FZ25_9SPHN|nr:glycosyltransferase family 4 protein [Sphingomonas glacialis]TPG54754.1 glycosyltransferase [Sphingomonas glacialis]
MPFRAGSGRLRCNAACPALPLQGSIGRAGRRCIALKNARLTRDPRLSIESPASKAQAMIAGKQVRCAVVVGNGDFSAYLAGTAGRDEPRIEFIEIARATGGDCLSYTSGAAKHGGWFCRLFAKRPNLGSAVHAACVAHRYDAIYVTGEDVGMPLALLLRLRGWRGRLVCLAHYITPRRARIFKRIGAGAFHRVITVSQAQAASLVTLAGFPATRVRALHNWVDDRFFDPALVDKIPDVGFVACGAENRDYAGLRRAFAETPQHVMRIFGHGFFGTGVAGAERHKDGPSNVVAMPRVSFAELRNYYGSAEAVVVPLNGVTYAAGVTGAVEAMACGRPVIATETTGIAEYLGQIDPRLRVPPGDAHRMAEAVQLLADTDLETRAAWGQRNRDWVVQHCSLDRYVAIIRGEMIDRDDVD